MIRMFMDTEFTDFPGISYDFMLNQFGKDMSKHNMISIALYGGSEESMFYGELSDYPSYHSSEFVKLHVEPYLGWYPDRVMDRESLRIALVEFLNQFIDQGIELMFDSSYDWALFNELMVVPLPHVKGRNIAGMIDREKFKSFFAGDSSQVQHHALCDVRAQYVSFDESLGRKKLK